MATPKVNIAYLGLGNMGLPMAINLTEYIKLNKLSPLKVWNRSMEKYKLIEGAEGVQDAASVVHMGCNVIFTSFANDAVAEDVYETLFSACSRLWQEQVIFIDQSTLMPKKSGMCVCSPLSYFRYRKSRE